HVDRVARIAFPEHHLAGLEAKQVGLVLRWSLGFRHESLLLRDRADWSRGNGRQAGAAPCVDAASVPQHGSSALRRPVRSVGGQPTVAVDGEYDDRRLFWG